MKIGNSISAQYIINQDIADKLNSPIDQLPVVSENYKNHQKRAIRKEDNSSSDTYTPQQNPAYLQSGYSNDTSQANDVTQTYQPGDLSSSNLVTGSYVSPSNSVNTNNSTLVYQENDYDKPTSQAQRVAERYHETGLLNANSNTRNIDFYI